MNDTSFLSLVHNAALLLALVFLFDLVIGKRRIGNSSLWRVLMGFLLGSIGMLLMMTPWVFVPGIIFDTRSILIGISGLFFGTIPAVIAMAMTAVFRIYQGGVAVWMGVSVIIATGTIGILWRRSLRKPLEVLTWRELYVFGLVIHVVMLACAFVLPPQTTQQVLANISLPVMVIYPFGTLLLGQLMVNRLRRERIADELIRAEERMRSLVEILQQPVKSVQEFLDFTLDQAIRLTESKIGTIFFYSEERQQFTLASISQSAMAECTIPNSPTCYELSDTGLWGEAVRQRKAIINNSYQNTVSLKKGFPSSHVQIAKFLTIPVFRGEQIVAVIGLGNKETDYDEADVLQLILLMDGAWKATERKRVQEVLRESEERYKAIVNNLPNGLIHIFDRDFRFQFNAGEEMAKLGWTNEILLGKTIFEVLGPDNGKTVEGYFQLVLQGKTVKYEWNYRDKDFIVHATPLRDHAEKIQNILALFINITDRKQAEKEIQSAQENLIHLLNESNQSRLALLSVLEDQKEAESKLKQLNTELEQRIQDRTSQLVVANKELESFAYSVSHDLRAPLRAMDGFSGALLEDYRDQLDKQGKHYLERIQEATRRMGKLIEDLLNLSRVTRRELTREQVNLSEIAQQIAADLVKQDPQRQVDFEIAPDLVVQADINLLKIALENLLNNAYKFSSQRAHALVQVGVNREADEQVYFVRDNGSGFDMAYADKLFTPFQRLHSPQVFPGTGIGLVTVHRIITRHGGRLWPEAAVDQGATFYFTLGETA